MRSSFFVFTSLLAIAGCSSTASPNDGGNDATDIATHDAIVTTDQGPDAPLDCGSDGDCAQGQICVFQSAGCATRGVCAMDFGCGRVSLPYCGCNGVTFFDHCAGPTAQWVSQGECPTSVDAGVSDAGGAPDSGGGACPVDSMCSIGLSCCGGGCMNLQNDPLNCGSCGHVCTGATSMCLAGACSAPACGVVCEPGEVCCAVDGPGPSRPPQCFAGTTCPVGCPACQ